MSITLNNKTLTVITDEDNQIKQWLSPLEPEHKHRMVASGNEQVSGME